MGHNLATKNRIHKYISHFRLKFKLKLKMVLCRESNNISTIILTQSRTSTWVMMWAE